MLESLAFHHPNAACNHLLSTLLDFTFTCKPKDALAALDEAFKIYELQLEVFKQPELLVLAKEILISQFEEQFPAIISNVKFMLDSILTNVIDPKCRAGSIDSKTLVKKFEKMVLENFSCKIPNIMLAPYITCIKELLSWDTSYEPMNYITKEEFESVCYLYINKFATKSIIPIDTKELLITDEQQQNLYIACIRALAFGRTKFTTQENSEWAKIIVNICELMPVSRVSLDEGNTTISKLTEMVERTQKKELANDSLFVLLIELVQFNKHQVITFTISLFAIISGYYRSNGSFTKHRYSPVLRSSIRKTINKFNKLIKDKHKEIASIINFEYYKIFEKAIGEHLHIRSSDPDLSSKEKKKNLAALILMEKSNEIYLPPRKLHTSFYLENLTPNRYSPHVVICISGFLSEESDMKEDWGQLISADKESCIYAVRWPSNTFKGLFTSESSLAKYLLPIIILPNAALLVKGIIATINGNNIIQAYSKAEKEAKFIGHSIANIILRSEMFRGQYISLVGFSLGTKVLLSCIKELGKINVHERYPLYIDNLVLMGSAAIMKKKSLNK